MLLGVFRKLNIFWGIEEFVDIFGGHHKIGLYLEVISMHFRVFSGGPFLKLKVWNGGYFGVARISYIYLGCLK